MEWWPQNKSVIRTTGYEWCREESEKNVSCYLLYGNIYVSKAVVSMKELMSRRFGLPWPTWLKAVFNRAASDKYIYTQNGDLTLAFVNGNLRLPFSDKSIPVGCPVCAILQQAWPLGVSHVLSIEMRIWLLQLRATIPVLAQSDTQLLRGCQSADALKQSAPEVKSWLDDAVTRSDKPRSNQQT